jgi:DNA primase
MPLLVDRRERSLLLVLLNHPWLFDEVGEAVMAADWSGGRYLSLWRDLTTVLSRNSGLDAQALYVHLSALGFSRSLDELLGAGAYDHAQFARPDASPEDVRDGWQHVWAHAHEKQLESELEEAKQALARDPSEANWARLRALKRELETGRIGSDDPDLDGQDLQVPEAKG